MKIELVDPQPNYWGTTKLYLIDGVKYRKDEDESFYRADDYNSKERIICSCENDKFLLHYGSYEIFAECSQCGAKESVYSG